LPHKNNELRIRQHGAAADPATALGLARQFVAGKIRNCRTLLRRKTEGDGDGLLESLAQSARRGRIEAAGRSTGTWLRCCVSTASPP
jgi:CRISPR/Cas system-associated endonuclease Cas1